MIYEYDDYFIVQFSNKTRARYSKRKYDPLINKIVKLSIELDKKIYNYYEIIDSYVKIYYWNQQEEKIVYGLIDLNDLDKVSKQYWSQNCNGYFFSRHGNTRTFLHRFITNLTDNKLIVDHINHNILDNRKENLRAVSPALNNINRGKEFNGVHLLKNGMYEARMSFKGKEYRKKNITKEEAINLRAEWEAKMFNDQL